MVYTERAEKEAVSCGTSHVRTTENNVAKLHHFGEYSKRAVKSSSLINFRLTCDKSVVSLLESGE